MLQQCCNHSKQCRNNVVTLCCAENRRCQSSRVTSPLDFLKVVRLVFWSGVVGPGWFALRARSLALRAHCRATPSKARLVSKSTSPLEIGAAQPRSVREIAPKPVSLCVNRSHVRYGFRAVVKALRYSEHSLRKWIHGFKIRIGNSMICSDIWHKYHEWYFEIVIRNFTSR